MAVGDKEHAHGLLDWLYVREQAGTPTSGVSGYLESQGLELRIGYDLARWLRDRDMVLYEEGVGAPECTLTTRGRMLAEQRRATLNSPARRADELRRRMLRWLDAHEQDDTQADWDEFLETSEAVYTGDRFGKREAQKAAEYLDYLGLIKSVRIEEARVGWVAPTLTAHGYACLTDFDGSVVDFLARGRRGDSSAITHNTFNVRDNYGNLAMASANVAQNINQGVDAAKVVELVDLITQNSSALKVSDEALAKINKEAEDLRNEAGSDAPNKSIMRRMLAGLKQVLVEAPETVARTMLLGGLDEVVRSIAE